MQPVYRVAHIRAIEQAYRTEGLMQKAGAAIARHVQGILPEPSSVLILVGPGNNGGDALVAASLLKHLHKLTVVFCGDHARQPADAAAALDVWIADGGELLTVIPEGNWELAIDGLFGIGLGRPLENGLSALVNQINALHCPVLSVDIPSGLCANTGRVLGNAIRASQTLTFITRKPGLLTLDGPDYVGEVLLETLGLTTEIQPSGYIVEQEDVATLLPKRRRNSNKGSFGNVAVLGGTVQMTGAAVIAARAALLTGAGRVYAGLLAPHAPKFDVMMPELMVRGAEDIFDLPDLDCLVVGPGMGQSDHAKALLKQALASKATLLLDADALNLLATDEDLQTQCRTRQVVNIATPHPGEAARMLSSTVAEIQADRITAALEIAKKYHAVTVLKGCGTVIAMPSGDWYINHSGNPGLASAGMGDALAGIIAALIAQGLAPEQAVLLGVHVHGAAADTLVEHGIGPIGLTASEVMMEVRRILNQWAEWGQT